MAQLLQHYSLSDILMFIVILALAVKSLISFFDWAYDRLKKVFNKEHCKLSEKEELERRLQHGSEVMTTLKANQEVTDKILNDLSAKIDMLIDSDKDDIKSYITREHHYFCYQVGWIDDFSLDCLERRYEHYADEGGNSFIEGFMNELRALPKQSPQEKKEYYRP